VNAALYNERAEGEEDVADGGTIGIDNPTIVGTDIAYDAGKHAVKIRKDGTYHFNWSVMVRSEKRCCPGDYLIALETMDSHKIVAQSGARAGICSCDGEVTVHGHTVKAFSEGTELVLRNRSGKTITLSTAEGGAGYSYCASLSVTREG